MKQPAHTTKKMTPPKSHVASLLSDMKCNKFNTAHLNLLTCGLYLGNNHFEIDEVTWCKVSFNTCLVTKDSTTARDAANALLSEMPSAKGTMPNGPTKYKPAILSAEKTALS